MNDEDVVSNALSLGIKHFRSQEYVKLVKVFTKAIDLAQSYDQIQLSKIIHKPALPGTKLIHPKFSTLLDSRALAYEKLRKFRQAGKDGEDLIELDPYNCKGYLRVCKILTILESEIDAYKVVSKGVKKIQYAIDHYQLKHTALFDQLIRQKTELAKILKNKQAKRTNSDLDSVPKRQKLIILDPIIRFPTEIFKEIISYTPFRELNNLMMVSKNWHLVISGMPEFWEHIELRKPITSVAFKKLYNKISSANARRYHKRIEFLKMLPRRTDEKSIMNVMLNMNKLQILKLQIILQELDLKNLLIMLVSSKLGRFNLANLRDLKIESSVYLNFENYLFEMLPNLQKFEIIINDLKIAKHIVEFEQNNELLGKLASNYPLRKYPNLQKISIICKFESSTRLPFEQLLNEQKFPNLQTLIIVGFKISNMNIFKQPNLEDIILEQNPELSLSKFLSSNSQFLQTLYLREYKVTTNDMPNISLKYLKKLRVLDLTGSTISYNFLLKILQLTNENLEILNIGACANLVWQSSAIDRSTRLVNFEEIISLCPNLVQLSLNQSTNLNDFTLQKMGSIILSIFEHYKLEILDLSFNNITGHGLIEFFQLNKPNKIKINKLIVDGNDIKNETLKFLLQKNYINNLQYEFSKKNWKQFGVNCYSPGY